MLEGPGTPLLWYQGHGSAGEALFDTLVALPARLWEHVCNYLELLKRTTVHHFLIPQYRNLRRADDALWKEHFPSSCR